IDVAEDDVAGRVLGGVFEVDQVGDGVRAGEQLQSPLGLGRGDDDPQVDHRFASGAPRASSRPSAGKIRVERTAAKTSAAAVEARISPSSRPIEVIATTSGS